MKTFEEFAQLSGESYELLQQFGGLPMIQNQFGTRRMAFTLLAGGQPLPSGDELEARVSGLEELITEMQGELSSAQPEESE